VHHAPRWLVTRPHRHHESFTIGHTKLFVHTLRLRETDAPANRAWHRHVVSVADCDRDERPSPSRLDKEQRKCQGKNATCTLSSLFLRRIKKASELVGCSVTEATSS
jgi:hypothetical protein